MSKCGEWFNVKENPPKEHEEVIVLCKNGDMHISSYYLGYGNEQYWKVKGPLGSGRRIATNRILLLTPKPTLPEDNDNAGM